VRNLTVFIILIAAFFLLLTDRNGKGNGSGKGSPSKEATQNSGDETQEALSDEYKPQDLSKYSNIQKLNDDFDYRRSKLEFQLNEEVKEFIKDHDRYGKDKEAYDKMAKHHADLRQQFYENRMKTLKSYSEGNGTGNGNAEEPINTDLR
jgi:predicted house-cleaning noncanonical NTP pyrophosphatase (MazG superfamily)